MFARHVILSVVSFSTVFAQLPADVRALPRLPASFENSLRPPETFALRAITKADVDSDQPRLVMQRLGLHRGLGSEVITIGSWEQLGGKRIWRIALRSPGRIGLATPLQRSLFGHWPSVGIRSSSKRKPM